MPDCLCVHALTSVSMSVEVRKQPDPSLPPPTLPPSFPPSLGALFSPPHHWLPSLVECLNVLSSVIKVFLSLFSCIAPGSVHACVRKCVCVIQLRAQHSVV